MSTTAGPSDVVGPGITAASFSLAVPLVARHEAELLITCDVPVWPPQTDPYQSLVQPSQFRITLDADEDGCATYEDIIGVSPELVSRVTSVAEATEAAAERLREIYTTGSSDGLDGFRPGWHATVEAFQNFNEDLYTGIVRKELSNLEDIYPHAGSTAHTAFDAGSMSASLPFRLREDVQNRESLDRKVNMYKAVHAAGESLKKLSTMDPSMTYRQPSTSVFRSAGDSLLGLGVARATNLTQLERDVLSLKHPKLSELTDPNGHANTRALQKHIRTLVTNAEAVSQLSDEFEQGKMDIDQYVERLLSFGQSEEADTDMADGVSDSATIVPATDG
jgi:hypothetical protein